TPVSVTITQDILDNGYTTTAPRPADGGTVAVSATITDQAGNTSAPGTDSAIVGDTTAPTVSITIADTALSIGETTTVTFQFSEAVIGFDNSDVTVENGTLGTLTSNDGGITWVGTFTPTANIEDTSNLITVANTYTDLAGNAGSSATSDNYSIDTLAPTLTISDNVPGVANGPVTFTFTFSEAVTGFTADDVTVTNGNKGTFTTVNGQTYTLVVTPTGGEISVNVPAGAAQDLAGNNSIAANATQVVDLPPVVDPDLATLVGAEDSVITLNWSDFGISDTDSAESDLGVIITTVPVAGTLEYQGTDGTWSAVSLNQSISKTDIDAGKLRFTPGENESGFDGFAGTGVGNQQADYAHIGFRPTDGSNQGEAATLVIDITPVADAPLLSLNGQMNLPDGTGLQVETWTGLPLGTNGNGANPDTLQTTIDNAGTPSGSGNLSNVSNSSV
ncbi:Ig-like domain-containing protein, partial [Geminocystis sp. CENA526]|uniref:Ig-like domain-containing protein n=1 Tax=Geminocystis sp. CENA526 TaxID=1355871 RepID=UPI003D6F3A81